MKTREEKILECVHRLAPDNEFHARVVCENEAPEEYRAAQVRDNKIELARYVVHQVSLDTRSGHNAEDKTTWHIDSIYAFNQEQLIALLSAVSGELEGKL